MLLSACCAAQTDDSPVLDANKGAETLTYLNGILNATQFSTRSDIGAQVNAVIAISNCGEIYIPAGSYTQTTTIVMPRCTRLHGASAQSTLLNWKPTSGWAIVIADAYGRTNYPEGAVEDLSIIASAALSATGAIWVGGSTGAPGTPSTSIDPNTNYGDHLNINRVRVWQFGTGVEWGNNTWSDTLSESLISNNLTGLAVASSILGSGERINIINSSIQNNTHYAIYQPGDYAPYWSFKLIGSSVDYNGNGTTAPIQGGFISVASHFEQTTGPFFDTKTGGGVEDFGSIFLLTNAKTTACFGNLATGNTYQNSFTASLFTSTATVTDLFCDRGPVELLGIKLSGSANSSRGLNYFNTPAAFATMNQIAANQWAGVSACSGSTKAISLPVTYNSQPVIIVFDETTKGGTSLTTKSASGFTVSCTGASDVFDWMVVGNPK